MLEEWVIDYWKGMEARCGNIHDVEHPSTDKLWRNRLKFVSPNKRRHVDLLFRTFYDVCQQLLIGKEFTEEEIKKTEYYQSYILNNHARYSISRRVEKHCIKRHFLGSVELFKNIRDEGLRHPIDFVRNKDGKLYIWKGYKRFIICKVLEFKTTPIVIHTAECTEYDKK